MTHLTSSEVGRILEVADRVGQTSGFHVRVNGCDEDVAQFARDAARALREQEERGLAELREALDEIRELRAELAERQRTPAAHAA